MWGSWENIFDIRASGESQKSKWKKPQSIYRSSDIDGEIGQSAEDSKRLSETAKLETVLGSDVGTCKCSLDHKSVHLSKQIASSYIANHFIRICVSEERKLTELPFTTWSDLQRSINPQIKSCSDSIHASWDFLHARSISHHKHPILFYESEFKLAENSRRERRKDSLDSTIIEVKASPNEGLEGDHDQKRCLAFVKTISRYSHMHLQRIWRSIDPESERMALWTV